MFHRVSGIQSRHGCQGGIRASVSLTRHSHAGVELRPRPAGRARRLHLDARRASTALCWLLLTSRAGHFKVPVDVLCPPKTNP